LKQKGKISGLPMMGAITSPEKHFEAQRAGIPIIRRPGLVPEIWRFGMENCGEELLKTKTG
jgi:hypothetical protein